MKSRNMNLKKKFKGLAKSSRDVLVVVIGIAITFSLNNWISNYNEKKDMQRYLNAVKIELEDNLKIVDREIDYYQLTAKFRNYLLSHKPEDLRMDSLSQSGYFWIMQEFHFFQYRTSAFEMFKMSGAMRLLQNKSVLSTIWNTYERLEEMKTENDHYMLKKNETINNLMLKTNITDYSNFLLPEAQELRTFFMIGGSKDEMFMRCAETIRKTLVELETLK